ncbi:hypothetical protein HDV04_001886 [Boothiomyces sp. JEL0838]|nr:hypothetical protein HDV04_001886 [Boothiomyces sp. JEL0838]
MNAERIFKEEYLRSRLLDIDHDYSFKKLTFKSIQSISEFVCNQDRFKNGKFSTIARYLDAIVATERERQERERFALLELERLKLGVLKVQRPENLYSIVSQESIVSKWVYSNYPSEKLVSQLKDLAYTRDMNEAFLKLKYQAFNNPKFASLFFDEKSAIDLIESPEFRLII